MQFAKKRMELFSSHPRRRRRAKIDLSSFLKFTMKSSDIQRRMLTMAISLCVLAVTHDVYGGLGDCPEPYNHNSYKCAQYLERVEILKYPAVFTRDSDTLKINLKNGKQKEFKDTNQDNDQAVLYSLIKYFPDIEYALLEIQFWEGGTYDLVNMRDGKTQNIKGLPVISLNKKRLVSSACCDISGYSESVFNIYTIHASGLKLEESFTSRISASDVRWISDDRIELMRNKFSEDLYRKFQNEEDWYEKEPVAIVFKNGKWVIE